MLAKMAGECAWQPENGQSVLARMPAGILPRVARTSATSVHLRRPFCGRVRRTAARCPPDGREPLKLTSDRRRASIDRHPEASRQAAFRAVTESFPRTRQRAKFGWTRKASGGG